MSGKKGKQARSKSNKPILEDHREKKILSHRLPFVSTEKGAYTNWWDVPATGGYLGGRQTGEALAVLFLKSLRENGGEHFSNIDLSSVVDDMIEACYEINYHPDKYILAAPLDHHSIRGQKAAFFAEISRWLLAAVKYCGSSLDSADYTKLLQRANAGLAFTKEDERLVLEKAMPIRSGKQRKAA